jgi:HAD superfamily hydrolase (TIGR01484 family)
LLRQNVPVARGKGKDRGVDVLADAGENWNKSAARALRNVRRMRSDAWWRGGSRAREALLMYFEAVALDYDGTLADHGKVSEKTLQALRNCKKSGGRLILVTGRFLDNLRETFSDFPIFDRIVAENGAVVFDPASRQQRVIGTEPPSILVKRLQERGVEPLSIGKSIVATREPYERVVLDVIRELGLEFHIIFNKGAVMILPAGVDKGAGLEAALADLEISPHNVVGIGDAENDFSFMQLCGCSAAVANALHSLKLAADIKLNGESGEGVVELLELLAREDACLVSPQRHGIRLGVDREGKELFLSPHHGGVLIAGSSGVGKSRLATALTEHMAERRFEFCVFDPEGDYDALENAVSVGNAKTAPDIDEAMKLLRKANANVVVNTQFLGIVERPGFFASMLPRLVELRARTGRPHWLIIDEAHHLLPTERANVVQLLPEDVPAVIFLTVHPDAMAPAALKTVQTVIAVGGAADEVFAQFCRATGAATPPEITAPGPDEILFWEPGSNAAPRAVKTDKPIQAHKRHVRKYVEGDLGAERSFYFKGAKGQLNLKAQNLKLFMQIAAGIDEETWQFHRCSGDYSAWFREAVRDSGLADEVAQIEKNEALDAAASRERIAEAIEERYVAL